MRAGASNGADIQSPGRFAQGRFDAGSIGAVVGGRLGNRRRIVRRFAAAGQGFFQVADVLGQAS